MSKNILVLGGAGYIGSVVSKKLLDQGHKVTIVDNLSKGLKKLVDSRAEFYITDIVKEKDKLEFIIYENKYRNKKAFDVVMDFAAAKDAGESMTNPSLYTENILGLCNVLDLMDQYKIPKIIFSSTAAVYGLPQKEIIDETHPLNPINYYGFTKLEGEKIIEWYSKLKNINYVNLRYFNVAGDGGLKYVDPNPSNVFPILAETILGKRDKFYVYGNDFNTHDGSGVRDYIHISDLADAHIKAIDYDKNLTVNLGTSKGYSVFDLINTFESVSGKKLNYEVIERRKGDPDKLVTSYDLAKKELNWVPKKTLEDMVRSTLDSYN
jgi:UDP-glucose 4-epimerase